MAPVMKYGEREERTPGEIGQIANLTGSLWPINLVSGWAARQSKSEVLNAAGVLLARCQCLPTGGKCQVSTFSLFFLAGRANRVFVIINSTRWASRVLCLAFCGLTVTIFRWRLLNFRRHAEGNPRRRCRRYGINQWEDTAKART